MTTYNKQQDGNIMYTEYTVKAGETTFKQIAKNHLYGDENRSNEIRVMKDGKISAASQLQTGMKLLLPTTKYRVKAGETTVKQIARDLLRDESRFKEILQVKNGILAYPDENLHLGEELLLPPVFAVVEESATFTNVSLGGNYVRKGAGVEYDEIYLARIGTKFTYKKSSLTKDSHNNLWVRATSAGQVEGYICVKEGQAHHTNPKID